MTFKADSGLVSDVHAAVNVEPRRGRAKPSLLILHYTGMSSAEKAVKWLACAESRVSCHYVVAEDGRITQLVPERLRAWHAGVSYWRGETDINSHSIGIEIQNPGHGDGYPSFAERQMRAVIGLSRDIVARHRMRADGVLAHSDVAPQRKIDPGEKFSWARLARHGLGEWLRPSALVRGDRPCARGSKNARVAQAQRLLAAYGYQVQRHGELDQHTSHVLRAFQLHFRPQRIDGLLDLSTERTLARLVAAAGRQRSA